MAEQPRVIVSCVCSQVTYEAMGAPITSVSCYCDDCQEGARQMQSLPHAVSIQAPDGGTEYVAYRKDRVICLSGASLLRRHKIREDSATNRVVATCCNSPMLMNFDDGKHWVDIYRTRCGPDATPVQMRICTKFRPDGPTIPTDIPSHAHYPIALLARLVRARIAMMFVRYWPLVAVWKL